MYLSDLSKATSSHKMTHKVRKEIDRMKGSKVEVLETCEVITQIY